MIKKIKIKKGKKPRSFLALAMWKLGYNKKQNKKKVESKIYCRKKD